MAPARLPILPSAAEHHLVLGWGGACAVVELTVLVGWLACLSPRSWAETRIQPLPCLGGLEWMAPAQPSPASAGVNPSAPSPVFPGRLQACWAGSLPGGGWGNAARVPLSARVPFPAPRAQIRILGWQGPWGCSCILSSSSPPEGRAALAVPHPPLTLHGSEMAPCGACPPPLAPCSRVHWSAAQA